MNEADLRLSMLAVAALAVAASAVLTCACAVSPKTSIRRLRADYERQLDLAGGGLDRIAMESCDCGEADLIREFPYEFDTPPPTLANRVREYDTGASFRARLAEDPSGAKVEIAAPSSSGESGEPSEIVLSFEADQATSFAKQGDVIYAYSAPEERLFAFDLKERSLEWSHDLHVQTGWTYLRIVHGLVILTVQGSGAELHAYDRKSGALRGRRFRDTDQPGVIVAKVPRDDEKAKRRVQNLLRAGAPVVHRNSAFFLVPESVSRLAYDLLERDALRDPFPLSIYYGMKKMEISTAMSFDYDEDTEWLFEEHRSWR